MKKRTVVLATILSLILVTIVGIGVYVKGEIDGFENGEETVISIARGSSTSDIAETLKEENMISNPFIFRVYSKIKGYDGKYQFGNHTVVKGMGYDQLMKLLCRPADDRETVTVSIPEGYTTAEIAYTLEQAGVCSAKDFIEVLKTQRFGLKIEEKINFDANRIIPYEGFLFPETYTFYKQDDPARVAKTMLSEMDNRITDKMYKRMDEMGYTLDEIITLASIIQKESFTKESMAMVSSVFHNRLDSGSEMPRLESDVTVKLFFDLYDKYGVSYTKEQAAGYNTYDVSGLPAGPVACPGMDSIEAALYPKDTDYYFFVTDGDKNYYYSKTYEEHQVYVEKCRPTWN